MTAVQTTSVRSQKRGGEAPAPKEKKQGKKLKNASDFLIVFLTLVLVVIGLVMV